MTKFKAEMTLSLTINVDTHDDLDDRLDAFQERLQTMLADLDLADWNLEYEPFEQVEESAEAA